MYTTIKAQYSLWFKRWQQTHTENVSKRIQWKKYFVYLGFKLWIVLGSQYYGPWGGGGDQKREDLNLIFKLTKHCGYPFLDHHLARSLDEIPDHWIRPPDHQIGFKFHTDQRFLPHRGPYIISPLYDLFLFQNKDYHRQGLRKGCKGEVSYTMYD